MVCEIFNHRFFLKLDDRLFIVGFIDVFLPTLFINAFSLETVDKLSASVMIERVIVILAGSKSSVEVFCRTAENRHPPKAVLSDGLFFVRRTGTDYLKTGPVCAAAER